MSRAVRTTSTIAMRQANPFHKALCRVAAEHHPPNVFITIKFGDTDSDLSPFRQLQKVLELLRKLCERGRCVLFWVREREKRHDAIEHAHIAVRIECLSIKRIRGRIVGCLGLVRFEGILVKPCGVRPGCNAVSLVGAYFLKGGTNEVRNRYLTEVQRRRWSADQGVIMGKRIGMSHYLTRLARGQSRGLMGTSTAVRALTGATPPGR